MEFTRITRKYVQIPVTATLADGSPATVAGVDVALLTPGSRPTADTTWTAADYTDSVAKVLLAGPDAPADGALTLPGTADLWARVTDAPEVDAAKITRIDVK